MIRSIPEIFAKRAFTYLLKRFLGQYLETFAHEELSLTLNKGKGIVENVCLKVEALNTISEDNNLPVEFLHGSIETVSFEIPWTAPFTANSIIEFQGVYLVVQPKKCAEDVCMFGSMWESMTSSLQLAEECLMLKLENETEIDASQPAESVEIMMRAINTVLSKMKIKLTDTRIRIETLLSNGNTGVALEIRIKSGHCYDEAGEQVNSSSNEANSDSCDQAYQPSTFSAKKIMLEGISLYTSQFTSSSRCEYNSSTSSELTAGSPEMPPAHASFPVQKDDEVLLKQPILISRISGQQQICFKIKQNESIIGPKVDIQVNLGLVNIFLSPFQVQLLIELMNGLTKPGTIDQDNSQKRHQAVTSRPMRAEDFALIEKELRRQQENYNLPSKSLQNKQGWSSHLLDDSQEEFHLMTMEKNAALKQNIAERLQEPALQDLETSCSSTGSDLLTNHITSNKESESTRTSKLKGSSLQTFLDPLSEQTQIHASCSNLCIIILHDNISDSSDKDERLKSVSSLRNSAEKYFDELLVLIMHGLDFKDFQSMRDKLSKLCQTNHLRFMVSNITFEANERASSTQRHFSTSLSVLDLQVLECVFSVSKSESLCRKPVYMEILTFKHEDLQKASINANERKEPCFKMKYDQFDYGTQMRVLKQQPNKLYFTLAPVSFEIDISLTDRIHSLINQDVMFSKKDVMHDKYLFSWKEDVNQISQKTDVLFKSPFVLINLRFPIPDLRPLNDMERVPWWQQNIRKEILIMEMIDFSLSFLIDNEQTRQKCEFQCKDFHGLLQMSPDEEPISFLRVAVDPEAEKAAQDDGFDWPRLVIYIDHKTSSDLLNTDFTSEENEDVFPMSITDALISCIDKPPSPFCSNSVLYGSKLHSNADASDKSGTGPSSFCGDDEIIMPADKNKIIEFIDGIVSKSHYVFDFSLPTVNIILPDKYFFEVLYNRVLSDLVVWENAPLNTNLNHEPSGLKVHVPGFNLNPMLLKDPFQTFYACSSNYQIDSNSESDEESGIYYSVSEHYMKRKQKQKKIQNAKGLTKMSISLNIDKGSLLLQTPLQENNAIIPGYCGKLQLCVKDSKFFIASSYRGDPNESYLCLLSNDATVHHRSVAVLPVEKNIVQPYIESNVKSSSPIIYHSERGVSFLNSGITTENSADSLDVFSLAIHILRDPNQHIKTFKMALGIQGSTLRHYMCSSHQLWLNQFTDFIDVEDYPISGYIPSTVVVELHLHLENCAIDYRPLHLPYRTVLLVDNFSLSTNITASTNTSTLRIISEELCLFISNNTSAQFLDLKKDYVCVIDSGLIDLSMRFTSSDVKPKFELCASNNMIHIRTCADSCRGLQTLIHYLASYGDFTVETSMSPSFPNDEVVSNRPVSVVEDVHNMMVEAMKDCSSSNHPDDKKNSSDSEWSTDDEFCILELEPGTGSIPKDSEPRARTLISQPIRIIDNHFTIPSGKSDLLKAPKHFPEALISHTLREMSITWHMYGGNDFSKSKCNEKKHVRINKDDIQEKKTGDGNFEDDQQTIKINSGKSIVSFCKVTPLNDEYSTFHYSLEHLAMDQSKANDPRLWIARGGQNRNLDVLIEIQMNKIKFQHEKYPEDSEYASRYVLLINDIEIRDRLATSEFNKLLYQYTSESMPRQTHANMVVVKAVSVRPDPKHGSQECSLKISCKPLRLHIDQDALMFLYEFCKEFADSSAEEFRSVPDDERKSSFHTNDNVDTAKNLISSPFAPSSPLRTDASNLTFFRSFSFSPDVLIRIDYRGKHIIMEQGALQGLFLGLAQLDCSEIKLKRLSYRHGLLGLERLLTYAGNEWVQDIKKNQLPSILGGIGPMHSFVQLFQGLKDLVWLPVEQYRKDGQIVRGLQRGVSSFSTSTASAFLELTSRVVRAIQGAAEVVYDMLSPGPSVAGKLQRNMNQCKRTSQPADIRDGVTTAYNVIREGLGDTAKTIAQVATVEHEHKGFRGAVGGVLRQIPPAAVTPIILGTEAAYIVLGGVKHQLVPDARKEAMDKWRTKSN